MNEITEAEALSNQVEKQLGDLPAKVEELILRSIAQDTPVGAALREEGGDTLRSYLGTILPADLPRVAERFMHMNQALSYETMLHAPDLGSLIKVGEGAANMSDEDSGKFYSTLQGVAKVIPGRDQDGTVVSRYHLYQESADNYSNDLDVMPQIRDALADLNTPPEERLHWENLARQNVPELENHEGPILASMLPDSASETQAVTDANAFNDVLGSSAGKLMHALTGSSQPQPEEENTHSYLTDPEVGREHREIMERHNAMQADADTDDGFGEGGFNTASGGA
jgi:hypothetical protein